MDLSPSFGHSDAAFAIVALLPQTDREIQTESQRETDRRRDGEQVAAAASASDVDSDASSPPGVPH